MAKPAFHPTIIAQAKRVTGKRPRAVIDHILKYGQVTTEELKDVYGYNHPPRAARDVRECGIPLRTVRVLGKSGRKIGAYTFDDPTKIEHHKLDGRQTFSKAFKQLLAEQQGLHCAITGERFTLRYLSIDHRIPYEVAGDGVAAEGDPDAFMLISAAAQRQKSWSCENCPNLKGPKAIAICKRCFWASPEDYDHVATEERRRVDIHWIGDEVAKYRKLKKAATRMNRTVAEHVKKIADDSVADGS